MAEIFSTRNGSRREGKGNMTIELYDLKTDPTESNDLASENQEIVAKIEAIMKNEHTTADIDKFKIKQLGDK